MKKKENNLKKIWKKTNSNFLLFITLLFFFSTYNHAFITTTGGTGLHRLKTAITIPAGELDFSISSTYNSLDKGFFPNYPHATLWDEDLSLTYGFNDFLEGYIYFPLYIDRTKDDTDIGPGDLEFSLKLIYPPYPHRLEFDLGFIVTIGAATGAKHSGFFKRHANYNTSTPFSANCTYVQLLVPFLLNFDAIADVPINLHWFFGELFMTSSGSFSTYQAGWGIEYYPLNNFTFSAEINGETKAARTDLSPDKDPLWFTLSVAHKINNFEVSLGWEYLLSNKDSAMIIYNSNLPNEYATSLLPRHGLFANITLKGNIIPQDYDHDGIFGLKDKCPHKPEDVDGHLDSDGCPEYDNDNDGIMDLRDKCPLVAEDFDGFRDHDGCPEEDNDNDGILDNLDKCPNSSEDLDGFDDLDGCPELDNDLDSILDLQDKCPLVKEDYDGFMDNDGCPDIDNDGDGILDINDKCPNKKEIFNGINDLDGCPDETINKIELNQIFILYNLKFSSFNQYINHSNKELLTIIKSLKYFKNIQIELRSHCDSFGSTRTNKKKTQDRANSIKEFLVSKGIESSRITTKGFGEDYPIISNKDALGRKKNNRIELIRIK